MTSCDCGWVSRPISSSEKWERCQLSVPASHDNRPHELHVSPPCPALQGRHYHQSHFTDGETEAWRLQKCSCWVFPGCDALTASSSSWSGVTVTFYCCYNYNYHPQDHDSSRFLGGDIPLLRLQPALTSSPVHPSWVPLRSTCFMLPLFHFGFVCLRSQGLSALIEIMNVPPPHHPQNLSTKSQVQSDGFHSLTSPPFLSYYTSL